MEEPEDSSVQNINQGKEHSLKHPLKQSWTFWYFDMNGGAANWDENLKKVVDVGTIEDFWAVYIYTSQHGKLLTKECSCRC